MENRAPSEEQAAQRKEELEDLGAGMDRLHQHQQKIADHLQQEQHHVAEIQGEVAEESGETHQITERLKPSTKPESAP